MAEYNKSGQIGNCSACMLICMLQHNYVCGAVLPPLERDLLHVMASHSLQKTESSTGWQF